MYVTLTIDSPLGSLRLVARGASLTHVALPGGTVPDAVEDRSHRILAAAAAQLDAYFSGTLVAFELPVAPPGTVFQRRAWDELCRIPYGATISYGEQARRVGRPHAARAVGAANGKNPIAIVVPCHRVIGAGGALVGYGGGLPAKRWLLEHERAHASTSASAVTASTLGGWPGTIT
jgi:methylated-DNA-[protein]-cysteine S-methyltransferase